MHTHSPKSNRGPAAAAENRAAIITAARYEFSAHGYRVPLNAIARRAGVSQGVFYRHFRSRTDLAAEVFVQNFSELRALAEATDLHAFTRFWRRVLELTVAEVAFVELVFDARSDFEEHGEELDLAALTQPLLERAQSVGIVDAALTLDDVILTQRMAYGIAKSRIAGEDLHQRLEQMLRMFRIPSGGAPQPAVPHR